jgi:hypothetical protein
MCLYVASLKLLMSRRLAFLTVSSTYVYMILYGCPYISPWCYGGLFSIENSPLTHFIPRTFTLTNTGRTHRQNTLTLAHFVSSLLCIVLLHTLHMGIFDRLQQKELRSLSTSGEDHRGQRLEYRPLRRLLTGVGGEREEVRVGWTQ